MFLIPGTNTEEPKTKFSFFNETKYIQLTIQENPEFGDGYRT